MTSGTRPALSARAVFRKQETLPGKRQNNTGAESVESLPGRGASTTERRCFQRRANAATDETPAVERKLVCACRTGHPPLPCRRYSRRRSASGMFRPPRGAPEGTRKASPRRGGLPPARRASRFFHRLQASSSRLRSLLSPAYFPPPLLPASRLSPHLPSILVFQGCPATPFLIRRAGRSAAFPPAGRHRKFKIPCAAVHGSALFFSFLTSSAIWV